MWRLPCLGLITSQNMKDERLYHLDTGCSLVYRVFHCWLCQWWESLVHWQQQTNISIIRGRTLQPPRWVTFYSSIFFRAQPLHCFFINLFNNNFLYKNLLVVSATDKWNIIILMKGSKEEKSDVCVSVWVTGHFLEWSECWRLNHRWCEVTLSTAWSVLAAITDL